MGISADVKAFAGFWVGFPLLFVVIVTKRSFFLGCGGAMQTLMLYIRMKLKVEEQNFSLLLWGISREYITSGSSFEFSILGPSLDLYKLSLRMQRCMIASTSQSILQETVIDSLTTSVQVRKPQVLQYL